jgi:ElaB/YqjD/DUF883 family membrane-anchored ribosome-binding protein
MESTRSQRGPASAAEQAADTARQRGKEVTQTAAEETKGVAQDVREQGQAVAEQAKTEVRHVAEEAKSQLRGQAQEQTTKVTQSLRRLSEQVNALAQGRPQESGRLADYVRQAAEEIQQTAGRVETRGFDGVVQDTENFARKRPGAFLLAAAAVGFSAGRLMRGGAEARQRSPQHPHPRPSGSGDGSSAAQPAASSERPPAYQEGTKP